METFWELLRDPAHWYFELLLIVIFDVVIGLLVWQFIQKASFTTNLTTRDWRI